MQICLHTFIFCSRRDSCSRKSSCLLRSCAMQHPVFSRGQTGLHFAQMPSMLKPHSSSVCLRPFAAPASVVIFCPLLWNLGCGLFIRITVFFCFLCAPPFDRFISKAQRASSPSEVCADD